MKRDEIHVVSDNRKAWYDYAVEETYEAGLVLTGTEVKSLRLGHANLRDSYAVIEGGEVFLYNVHISPFEQAHRFNHEPLRKRKLLMHKQEIVRLLGRVREKGYTLVALKLYFKGGRAKVELGLARGKKQYDKRHDIADRDAKREVARSLRSKDRD
ncbi:MAG: SsrA-binding protein SmpB [Symbiobacteriia bacterium]